MRGSRRDHSGLPAQTAQAQDYPSKPVTFVTPAAAGNSPDVVTRVVADRLTALWKQQVVVINRPGAGGLIAAQAAAQLPKDGYSIYMTQASTYTVLPIQQGAKMPVDLHKSFTPVGMVGEQPIAIGVQKDVKANNVAELVKLANSSKDGMLFAATNRGGQSHLTGELFRDRSKSNISFVHSAGAAVSINDVIAGRIPIMFEGLAGLAPGTQSGDIRLLGVASETPAEPAEPAHHRRDGAGRRVERLDRHDGAGGRARRDRSEAQQGPAHRRRRKGRDRALPAARHLQPRSTPRRRPTSS